MWRQVPEAHESTQKVARLIRSSKKYEELEFRAKKFLLYERILGFLANGTTFIVAVFGITFFVLNVMFNLSLSSWEMWAAVIPVAAIWMLGVSRLAKRRRKYQLEDNEWATLYSYLILEELDRSKTKKIELKRDYQRKALRYAKNFLSCIRKRWNIGSFKLVQDSFRKPLDELKKNLEYRIIPSLEEGKEEDIERVKQIMSFLLSVSGHLELNNIITLNREIVKIPSREPSDLVGLRSRIANYLTAHRVLKNVVVLSTVAVACCVFYYFVVTYAEVAKEYAFTGAIALFVAFVTVYYRRSPKE